MKRDLSKEFQGGVAEVTGVKFEKYSETLVNHVINFTNQHIRRTKRMFNKIEDYHRENLKEETYIVNGEYYIDVIPCDKIITIENCETKEKTKFYYEKIDKRNPGVYKKALKFLSEENGTKYDSRGLIYLITDKEYTKIGATSYNVEKRLSELQTGNPKKLEVIGSYRVKNKLTTEKFLHKKFKEKNILGEWFKLDQKEITDILIEKFNIENHNKPTELLDWEEENIDCSLNYAYELKVKYSNKLIQRNKNKYFNEKEKFLNSFRFKSRAEVKEILEFIENYNKKELV